MSGKVTIADIAKRCGVSKSSVSHALSGRRPISEKVKQKIFKAVDELNYHPSHAATALTTKRTMLIGVVSRSNVTEIARLVTDNFAHNLKAEGYDVAIGIAENGPDSSRKLLKRFSCGLVDGIINMMPQVDPKEAEEICRPCPVVTHMRHDRAPLHVDYGKGTRDCLEHLWSLGHRRIGFIASKYRLYDQEDPCLTSYKQFLTAKKVEYDPDLVAFGQDDMESGKRLAPVLMAKNVTAIFAGNDRMAIGVYHWAFENGIDIPTKLSVAGFDDSPLATAVCPQLTTVRLGVDVIAAHTVKCLLEVLEGDLSPKDPLKVTPTLVIRNSTTNPVT